MATTAFPVNQELTAIAMVYRNPAHTLIADEVLPRVSTGKKFTWTRYDLAQGYTVPNTHVGRKSEPTQVDFNGVPVNDEVEDWGLDDVVPNDEIEAWEAMTKPERGGPINPLHATTMFLEGLVQLDRELRVANKVFNLATYNTGYKQTLSGSSQWSDFANSNPLDTILTALDVPVFRPNIGVLGQQTATKLRQHPAIVQAVKGSAQTRGVVDLQELANVLGLKRIIVGASFVNNARRGQPAAMGRAWGKGAAFLYVDEMAAQTGQPTFGWTAQFGSKVTGDMPEPKLGLRGSTRVRNGESVKEVISAQDLGYYFANAVA
jgi:hypothetical protein